MLDRLLSFIAPHACIICRRTGEIVCSACMSELHELRTNSCIGCGNPVNRSGICDSCRPGLPFDAAVVFAPRIGPIEELINAFKFARVRSAYGPLTGMIAPLLPKGSGFAVVPVPTIGRHIRERGYDHAALIACRVARANGNRYAPLLRRRTGTVQYGADKATRAAQAAKAFYVDGNVEMNTTYIILDDITTTGASLTGCALALRAAGARMIIAAAIARQPLDEER